MEILLPVMETEDAKFLSQDVSVWQNNADWMYENGILKEKTDDTFLPKKLLMNKYRNKNPYPRIGVLLDACLISGLRASSFYTFEAEQHYVAVLHHIFLALERTALCSFAAL